MYKEPLFGPFVVKDRCKELKWYGTLFIGLSSWAIQIEAADCIIMCLQRLISQRGKFRLIRFDNQSYFVGAWAELIKAFTQMNHQKVNQLMQDNSGE